MRVSAKFQPGRRMYRIHRQPWVSLLAVAALGVWGWRAGQIGHSRVIGRLWSTALDLAVGLVIVGLEVAFR